MRHHRTYNTGTDFILRPYVLPNSELRWPSGGESKRFGAGSPHNLRTENVSDNRAVQPVCNDLTGGDPTNPAARIALPRHVTDWTGTTFRRN